MAKKNKSAAKSTGIARKTGAQTIKLGLAMFVPLILVLGVIPLIVQLQVIPMPVEVQAFWTQDSAADFFSYYKSRALMLTAIYMVGVFGYYKAQGMKDQMLQNKSLHLYFAATAVFALFALLSTVLANYKSIALWGGPERCEGLITILVYLLIMLYAMWAYTHKPDFKYIVLPLGILTFITGFLGVFQFFGHDLFTTSFGQSLIIPEVYRSQGELKMLFERGKIYGTMYHYNYMGSFGAMMVPLFLVLTLFLKERKAKIFCGAATVVALFALLGSTSRAGIIGLVLAAVCFIVFFGKKLIEHSKVTIGCIAVLIVFVFGVNIVTGGLALARIPSLLNDMKALVSSSDVDYHDKIAVRQIDLQDDKVIFMFQDDTLTIQKNSNHQPVIISGDGQTATAPAEDSSLTVGGYKMELQYVTVNEQKTPFLGLYLDDSIEFIVGLYDEGFCFVDGRMNKIEYVEAPSIGFEGKEKLGSARGYIWSRSLPVMLDSALVGHGADTFFAEFPQGDLLAKLYSYGTTQMIVDKPHNLYLQIGISHGVIALAAFFIMMAAYIIDSFKLYALRKEYSAQQTVGVAVALAVIGYLGAGFFNDSIVSVAPIFWALFGTGVAVNQLNKKEMSELTEE